MCQGAEKFLYSKGFAVDMTNVYRTKDFIVFQELSICENTAGHDFLMSNDIYYARTHKRDKLYEGIYADKGKFINGKRIRSGGFVRTYVYD